MDEDLAPVGERFSRFIEAMTQAAGAPRVSVVRELLDGHFGTYSFALPVVTEAFPPWTTRTCRSR